MEKFTKDDRSSWRYFWAHWCAFQMVAITLGVWRLKHLFHDWYKPWLKMFGMPYEKIQKFHRTHSNHHLEWLDGHSPANMDWISLIVDWECSQYTKEACYRDAREEMEWIIDDTNDDFLRYVLERYMEPKLKELGL